MKSNCIRTTFPAWKVASDSTPADIRGIAIDSRTVRPGDLFFALPGTKADGARFVDQAVGRGAAAVVSETEPPGPPPCPWFVVPDGRAALAEFAAEFYGHPERELELLGITGTNGKTTIAYLAEAIFRHAGWKCGVIGTVEYRAGSLREAAPLTTPESSEIFRLLRKMADERCRVVAMEVSSHSLDRKRLLGLRFRGAVFTNLTRDHLDYHGTMENYFAAKKRLFDAVAPGGASVVNVDDPWGGKLRSELSRLERRVLTYGMNRGADFSGEVLAHTLEGTRLVLCEARGNRQEIRSALIGLHNVYNILAAFAAGRHFGLASEQVAAGIEALRSVPGRLERVDCGQPFGVFVDYAHTGDALLKLVEAVRPVTPKRMILVFGCGGDRDRGKRPVMGSIAAEHSDLPILTSDNPRTEDPLKIIEEVEKGMIGLRDRSEYRVIPDRREAIDKAVAAAQPGDVVLVAGKGHEDYQILGEKRIHFDDREELTRALREKGFSGRREGLQSWRN
jgi:UDP-N-acetylmuramoyl-L-alanyl-D-glutamate--2,6-diaminopimelate ligase